MRFLTGLERSSSALAPSPPRRRGGGGGGGGGGTSSGGGGGSGGGRGGGGGAVTYADLLGPDSGMLGRAMAQCGNLKCDVPAQYLGSGLREPDSFLSAAIESAWCPAAQKEKYKEELIAREERAARAPPPRPKCSVCDVEGGRPAICPWKGLPSVGYGERKKGGSG